MVIGVEDDAVRPGEVAVGGDRDVFHRHRVVDIAADHVEPARLELDNDVAMPGKTAGRQLVEGHRAAAAPQADQIAALRHIGLDPLGFERNAGLMLGRRIDVIGMGLRIGEAAPAPAIRIT